MTQKKKKRTRNLTRSELIENDRRKSQSNSPQMKKFLSNCSSDLAGSPSLPESGQSDFTKVSAVLSSVIQHHEVTPMAEDANLRRGVFTVNELCDFLQVSRSTITRMERDGSLPGRISISGSVRYHRDIIEKWLYEKSSTTNEV
jgi:predicted DNA-binding transcriptional regulator AlpA